VRVTSDAVNYQGLSHSADRRTFATLMAGEGARIDFFRLIDRSMEDSVISRHSLSNMNWIDDTHLGFSESPGGSPGITILDRTDNKFNRLDMGRRTAPFAFRTCSTSTLAVAFENVAAGGVQIV